MKLSIPTKISRTILTSKGLLHSSSKCLQFSNGECSNSAENLACGFC